MTSRGPMNRLRRANPFPESPSDRPSPRVLRRTLQTLLALAGILAVGVGAAWAAGGIDPVGSLFGDDIEVVDSDYGLGAISVLEPATQESFDSLPQKLAFRASVIATRNTIYTNQENGDPPFTEHGVSRTEGFDPIPAKLSALGRGTTSSGSEVTVMVIEGDICAYFNIGGPSRCGSLDQVQEGAMIGGNPERGRGDRSRIYGLVADDVVSIRIDGSELPPTPVSGNAFDIKNLKFGNDMRLVALDADDNEVFSCTGGRLGGPRWTKCG